MKFEIRELGAIKYAECYLKDFNIICGKNNTGKTYATYALFGFLKSWKEILVSTQETPIDINTKILFKEGRLIIDLEDYYKSENNEKSVVESFMDTLCDLYSRNLNEIFASNKSRFKDSKFLVHLEKEDYDKMFSSPYQGSIGVPLYGEKINDMNHLRINLEKDENSTNLILSIAANLGDYDESKSSMNSLAIPETIIKFSIWTRIFSIIVNHALPEPYISSAERTGIATFREDLDFARNRFIDMIQRHSRDGFKNFDLFDILKSQIGEPDFNYPEAVNANVEFLQQLESIKARDSYIYLEHNDILKLFLSISDGSYEISNSTIKYTLNKKKSIKLGIDEVSSSARAVLDLWFYLRHQAKPGDLLMIDEPELNLHPENQRKLARLLASVSRAGIRVFITTHSDYIIRELNTLVLLHNRDESVFTNDILEHEGYSRQETLPYESVQVYTSGLYSTRVPTKDGKRTRKSKINTLALSKVDQNGIYLDTFDDTIDKMNKIQDYLVWGE